MLSALRDAVETESVCNFRVAAHGEETQHRVYAEAIKKYFGYTTGEIQQPPEDDEEDITRHYHRSLIGDIRAWQRHTEAYGACWTGHACGEM